MSLPEQGNLEKLLEKRENYLGHFNVALGNGALSQSTALNGTRFTSKESLLLEYDAASKGNQIPTFQGTVVSLPSRRQAVQHFTSLKLTRI
jgi:hypothetical protein